jgi:membrane protein
MDSLKVRFEAFQRTGLGRFINKLSEDQAPNLAALIAWGTLSAILPMLLGVLSLAGLVLRDQRMLDQVYNTLLSALPAEVVQPLTGVLDGMRQSAGAAGLIAIALFLINGSAFFSNMASVFDQAHHVAGRMVLFERIIALVMLLVTTLLLILTTMAAGLGSLVSNVPGVLPIGPALGLAVGWLVPIFSVFGLFLLVYRVLPNTPQTWRTVFPGALLSTVLLLLVTQLFPIYLSLFPPNHAYAVFGVFLVFTFYLYLVGFVFVLGAELNAFLRLETEAASTRVAAVTTTDDRAAA